MSGIIDRPEQYSMCMGNMGYSHHLFTTVFFSFFVFSRKNDPYSPYSELDANIGDHKSARTHYNEALKIAQEITHRQVLIEALLARGDGQLST